MDPADLLVRNEQAKLTATYLNGVAIATFAVGSLAPTVALVTGSAQTGAAGSVAILAVLSITTSAGLHVVARLVIAGLKS